MGIHEKLQRIQSNGYDAFDSYDYINSNTDTIQERLNSIIDKFDLENVYYLVTLTPIKCNDSNICYYIPRSASYILGNLLDTPGFSTDMIQSEDDIIKFISQIYTCRSFKATAKRIEK